MRAFAILALTLVFFTAVILPNDIGTDDSPATGHISFAKARHHHAAKPTKGGAAACVVMVARQHEPYLTSNLQLLVFRSTPTVANSQRSLALLL